MKNEWTVPCRWLACIVLAVLGCQYASSQDYTNDYVNRIGRPNFAVFQPVDSGEVDIANGNLQLTIPLGTFQERNGKKLDVRLSYSSKVYAWLAGSPSLISAQNIIGSYGGWQILVGDRQINGSNCSNDTQTCYVMNAPASEQVCDDGDGNPSSNLVWYWFSLVMPDGTSKQFYVDTQEGDPAMWYRRYRGRVCICHRRLRL